MPPSLRLAAVLALIPATLIAADPPADIKAPQSPPKPRPAWLKLVDQGQFDPRLKGYMTPEGFRVEIVAEQPTIVNPVGMAFGTDGTLFVLEWRPSPGDEWRETPEEFTYKDGTKRKVATMKKKTKDVLKVLKWNDDRKIYDKSEVILEDELPSTVLLHDGWIYTASRGTVRRYKQSTPGGAYDVKEVIAQGFCGFHHHQVSGLTIGNDGWLYITSGDDDNYVEGSDGARSTVLRTGAIFRCRPDGTKLHAYSMGWRNPYRDIAFDAAFNWFHVDNDNEDGSKFTGCRIMHVVEESDFGWRLFTGARCCRPDPVRGAVYGELPGKLPPMLKTGRGSPAGLLIYNDTRFPEHHRGWLIYPDVFRKLVRAYQVAPDGSTFKIISEFEFLKSDDPLFRPCHMITGPDGAMYVCDWRTDSGGAGKLWGDGQHGRIYRIRWVGDEDDKELPLRGMDSWARVIKQSDDELLKTLYAADFTDRVVAQHEIVRRGAKFRPALIRIVTDTEFPADARLLALGALQSMWNDDARTALISVLRDSNQDLVRLAADGLSLNCQPGDAAAHNALVAILDTTNPPARRAVILALGRLGLPGTEDYLISIYKSDPGRDVFMTDAIVRALERLGDRGVQKFLELADSGIERNLDRVVDAFLMFRTRAAVAAIPTVMRNPHLKVPQRVALLKSFANYLFDPPLGPDLLLAALQSQADQPTEVKKAGLEALGLFGQLSGERLTPLLTAWLQDADPEMRMTAIRTAEQTRAAGTVPILVKRVADETWTLAERTGIVRALRAFNDRAAAAPLAAIARDDRLKSPEGLTLRVEALRSLLPVDPATASAIAEAFLAKDAGLQSEAIAVLGTKPEGARKVAEMFLAKKLPRELLPPVSDALRKHLAANQDFNKLLTDVMRGGLLL